MDDTTLLPPTYFTTPSKGDRRPSLTCVVAADDGQCKLLEIDSTEDLEEAEIFYKDVCTNEKEWGY